MTIAGSAAISVPLLDLRPQYQAIRAEVDEAIARVVESQHFILGPEVEALEREIAAYCGTTYATGMSSGTDALLASLMLFRIEPGWEVITTPYTFFATAGVIARLRAKPVFVDIDPDTYNIDATAAANAMSYDTCVVIPVHLYGRMVDMDPIIDAAEAYDTMIVEDAAQAIGAFDSKQRRAGSIGDLGCFSFFPSKNLGAFGDAGMVVTNDDLFRLDLPLLRMHGMSPKYYHAMIGGNFRLDAIQAAVLRVKLKYLDDWTTARRANAARYRELFDDARITDRVTLPQDVPGHIYNQFVIRVRDRDGLREHLATRNIGTEVYYPVPLHLQECFQDLGYGPGDFPHAEAAARETLALPIYPELSDAQLAHVVDAIAAFVNAR